MVCMLAFSGVANCDTETVSAPGMNLKKCIGLVSPIFLIDMRCEHFRSIWHIAEVVNMKAKIVQHSVCAGAQ